MIKQITYPLAASQYPLKAGGTLKSILWYLSKFENIGVKNEDQQHLNLCLSSSNDKRKLF